MRELCGCADVSCWPGLALSQPSLSPRPASAHSQVTLGAFQPSRAVFMRATGHAAEIQTGTAEATEVDKAGLTCLLSWCFR